MQGGYTQIAQRVDTIGAIGDTVTLDDEDTLEEWEDKLTAFESLLSSVMGEKLFVGSISG